MSSLMLAYGRLTGCLNTPMSIRPMLLADAIDHLRAAGESAIMWEAKSLLMDTQAYDQAKDEAMTVHASLAHRYIRIHELVRQSGQFASVA